MPTRMTFEQEVRFYHSIGRLLDRWGYVDSLVSEICKTLIENVGHPSPKKVPWGLVERLAFASKCFENDPRFTEARAQIVDMFGVIKQIDEHRGFIVHGCKTDFFPEQMAVQFTKLDRNDAKTAYVQVSTTTTFDELARLADAAQSVVAGLVSVGTAISHPAWASDSKA